MATIKLNAEKLEELLSQHGAISNVAAGKLLGLHDATLSKIRSGKSGPGETFIANSLTVLAVSFDELFTVAA
jgi:hypothetical protein